MKQILIADDSPTALKLLEYVLAKLGYEILVASDGEKAWELYQTYRPRIVITDWMMPIVDGLEFCRRVRGEEKEDEYTYIVLLTAKGSKDDLIKALETGADDFITKPFDKDALAARLLVAERIAGLQRRVQQYEQLLPICMYCKKIRDQEETWVAVDEYLAEKTESTLSHGICPDCYSTQISALRKSRGQA